MNRKALLALFILNFNIGKTQSELLDFESAPINITIDSLTGCWQIGTPSKTIFDTAYSANHALMTDTINPYPDDSISYAYFSFPSGNFSSSYTLSFKHRYDAESNVDGGYIEYFNCVGGNWVDISAAAGLACPGYFIYYGQAPTTLLSSGYYGFSGTSSGWEETTIHFGCALLMNGEEVRGGMTDARFRFVFISDGNNTGQEGWIIDDIYWEDFGGICSGIEEYENTLNLRSYPTLTDDKISFETEKELFSKITIYDFSGKIVENFSFSQTNFKTLELSNLSNGLYFYSVEDGKATGKFLIEK